MKPMNLRTKTLSIIIIISLLLISLVNASARFILLKSFTKLEENYAIKNIQNVSERVLSAQNSLASSVRSLAVRNDTYTYIQDLNSGYVASNLIPTTFSNLKITFMVFSNPGGQVQASFGYDPRTNLVENLAPIFLNQISSSLPATGPEPDAAVSGITLAGDRLILFASHPILTSPGHGPPQGVLTVGRYIDEDFAAQLSVESQTKIQIEPAGNSLLNDELSTATRISQTNLPLAIKVLDSQTVAGYAVFSDASGKPAAILRSATDRDIYNQGYGTIMFFIYVVFLGSLFFFSAAILLLDRQIISRIALLNKAVSQVRVSASSTTRVQVDGKDEITHLASEINQMLASLESADRQMRQSQEQLEKLIEIRTTELVQVNENLQHEIDERELGQRALFDAYNEINLILSSITSIMIGVNNRGIVTQFNEAAARLFGISSIDAIGSEFTSLPIMWDWEKVNQDAALCAQENQQVRMEDIPLECGGEATRILGITLTPLQLQENERLGFLLVGADISERRLLEQQVSRYNRLEAIGELAAGVAHEINTPTQLVGSNLRFLRQQLSPVLNLIDKVYELNQAVKNGSATPPMALSLEKAAAAAHLEYFRQEAPPAIDQSLEGIDRISRIVGAMRFFSHPGGDHKEMANLNQVIQNALTLSSNEWKNVAEIITNLDPNLPNVECLPSELSQVVLNLIINAVHAIQDAAGEKDDSKGSITITSRELPESVEVRVTDTGTGIPEKIRAKIFDPFFTTKDVGRGTGQGLSIAHAVIVQKHQGTLEFETEIGHGTTFIIRLPRNPDHD